MDDELLGAAAGAFGGVFVVAGHLTRLTDARPGRLGPTTRQWLLLAVLARGFAGRAPSLTEAAQAYGSSRQNVKQIALGLEARGFLRLEADAHDGRTTRLALTERVSIFDEPEGQARGRALLEAAFDGLEREDVLHLNGPSSGGSPPLSRPTPTTRVPERQRAHDPDLAAALLAVHGLIHLIGFVACSGLATVDGFAYRTTALGGLLVFGGAGATVLAIAWLARCHRVCRGRAGRPGPAALGESPVAGLALVSLGLCVLALPEAELGITVNAVILSVLVLLALRPAPSGAPAA